MQDGDDGSTADIGGDGSGSVGEQSAALGGGADVARASARAATAAVTLEVDGDRVGVSAVEETNTLLVRATPPAWKSIRDVIERLDVMPMQVHIEAQVAEVQLDGRPAATA